MSQIASQAVGGGRGFVDNALDEAVSGTSNPSKRAKTSESAEPFVVSWYMHV